MHEYIRNLLFKELSKTTVEKLLKQLRKLDWENSEVSNLIVGCLSAPWNCRFNCVQHLASLVSGIMYYYEWVGFSVVDNILEDIRVGMEVNHPKFNQRRIASVKFLGELYNFRVVDSTIIFNSLFSFITFGVSPDPVKQPSVFDPADHLFRIRLACVLLDTCGHYFDRGSSKVKLDCFLTYLQRYYWMKREHGNWTDELPFPLEAENMVVDTIQILRPKFKIFANLSAAQEGVKKIEDEYKAKIEAALKFIHIETPADENFEADDEGERPLGPIVEEEEEGEGEADGERSLSASQEAHRDTESPFDGSEKNENEIRDEENVHVRYQKQEQCVEDEDFLSSFDKMMSESLQQRMQESSKVPAADFAVPTNLHERMKKIRFSKKFHKIFLLPLHCLFFLSRRKRRRNWCRRFGTRIRS